MCVTVTCRSQSAAASQLALVLTISPRHSSSPMVIISALIEGPSYTAAMPTADAGRGLVAPWR